MYMKIDEQLQVVSKRLKERMKTKNLTAALVQAQTGLALNSVKGVLSGKSCTLKTLVKICEAMEWTLFDVLNSDTPIASTSTTYSKPEVVSVTVSEEIS